MRRSTLAEHLERAVEFAQNQKEEKKYGQVGLFDESVEQEYRRFEFEERPEWDRMEKLRIENELMGFYFSGHPMDDYKAAWEQNVVLNLGHIAKTADRSYTLVGIIKAVKPLITKKGAQMAFATMTDYNGDIELTFFPEIWEKERDNIVIDKVVAVKGKVDRRENRDRPGFLVDALLNVDKLQEEAAENSSKNPERETVTPEKPNSAVPVRTDSDSSIPVINKAAEIFREVHIRLNEKAAEQDETLYPLRDLLIKASGDHPVFIHVPIHGGETVIRTASHICADEDTAALTHCEGVAEVWRE